MRWRILFILESYPTSVHLNISAKLIIYYFTYSVHIVQLLYEQIHMFFLSILTEFRSEYFILYQKQAWLIELFN